MDAMMLSMENSSDALVDLPPLSDCYYSDIDDGVSDKNWLWEGSFEKEFINIEKQLEVTKTKTIEEDSVATEIDLKKTELEFSIDDELLKKFIDSVDEHYLFENKTLTHFIDGITDYNELNELPAAATATATAKIVEQPTAIVYDDVSHSQYDNTLLTQLTPPQSPPHNVNGNVIAYQQPIAVQQQEQQQQETQQQPILSNNEHAKNYLLLNQAPIYIATPATAAEPNYQIWQATENSSSNINSSSSNNINSSSNNINNSSSNSNEVEHGMQIINELLNTRAQELHGWQDNDCESLISASICGSESPTQSESYRSSSNSSSSSSNDDEEWLPMDVDSTYEYVLPTAKTQQQQHLVNFSAHLTTTLAAPTAAAVNGAATKKRTRPYGRAIEDRKIRKKEQNKKAATRYRQKKKQELELVLGEEQELLEHNDKLKSTLVACQSEVKYLRKLLREFYKNKLN